MLSPSQIPPGTILKGDIVLLDGIGNPWAYHVVRDPKISHVQPNLMVACIMESEFVQWSDYLNKEADELSYDNYGKLYWFFTNRLSICPEGRFRMMKNYRSILRTLNDPPRRR